MMGNMEMHSDVILKSHVNCQEREFLILKRGFSYDITSHDRSVM